MKKNILFSVLALSCTLSLAACTAKTETSSQTVSSSADNAVQSADTSSTTASADTDSEEVKDDEIEIDAEIVKSSSIDLSGYAKPVEISSGGTYTISGTSENMLIVDAPKQDVTLVLDGIKINSADGPAIYIRKAASVTIQLKGDSSISSAGAGSYDTLNAALYAKSDLILEGSGTLSIQSGYEHGIKAKDTYVQNGGTLNITAPSDGIHINEDAQFNGGTVNITAGDEGIQSEMGLTFNNGTFTVSSEGDGLRAETSMVIEDGKYTVDTRSEGMESKAVMIINGGTVDLRAADDAINAIQSLTINGGTINAVSSGNDVVDSNGDLIINGGTVIASGTKAPEQAFDVDNTPFEIHGGTVIGLGTSVVYPTTADQPVIFIGSLSGTVSSVEIKDGNSSVLSAQFSSSSSMTGGFGGSSANLTLSSSKLKLGSTYDIYVNGSLLQSVTLSSQTTTIGSVSTMGGGMGGRQPGTMTGGFGKGNRG